MKNIEKINIIKQFLDEAMSNIRQIAEPNKCFIVHPLSEKKEKQTTFS